MLGLLGSVCYQAVVVLYVTAVVRLCVWIMHRRVSQVTGW